MTTLTHGVKKPSARGDGLGAWLDGLVLTGDGKTRSSWTTNPAGALRFPADRAQALAAFVGMESRAEEIPKVGP